MRLTARRSTCFWCSPAAIDRKRVSKAVSQERLWPATFVAKANLSNLVAEIRTVLNELRAAPMYTGLGYAFCGSAVVDFGPREIFRSQSVVLDRVGGPTVGTRNG